MLELGQPKRKVVPNLGPDRHSKPGAQPLYLHPSLLILPHSPKHLKTARNSLRELVVMGGSKELWATLLHAEEHVVCGSK